MKLKEFMVDSFQVSKGSVKIPMKGIIDQHREHYESLKKSGHFSADIYTIVPSNAKIVHVKVPSESVEGFQYDVLIEFSTGKNISDIMDSDIKIFSNCPSFVYTYAYIFAHWDPDKKASTETGKGMMIDSLKGRLPRDRMMIPRTEKLLGKEPVHKEPVVRNPMGIPMLDKSLYYAIFYIEENYSLADIIATHHNISMTKLLASVESFDRLMLNRKHQSQIQSRNKKASVRQNEEGFEIREKELNKRNLKKPMQVNGAMKMKTATRPKSTTRIGTAKRPRTTH